MVIKGEVCDKLKFVWLVGVGFLGAQIVHAVSPRSMPFPQELLNLGHRIAIQPCATNEITVEGSEFGLSMCSPQRMTACDAIQLPDYLVASCMRDSCASHKT